jgi:cellulose synthase/poly-beta-1,6-N-acetylglucosamine synthase-like glycosyltransferase
MATVTERLFWICLFVGLYPYAIYPFCVAFLKAVRPRTVHSDSITPTVTVVISAYNEAPCIEATVRNKLAQNYPQSLLDVMVASDASNDGTDEVLSQLARQEPRVTFFRQEPRGGKTTALNAMAQRARGDIIVFADANSMYDANSVRSLVAPFADPTVGYATGRMVYVDAQGSLVGDGCSAYMRYENRLRAYESALGSVVGVDGGVDAIRRVLYAPMRADQLPDFVLPLAVVEQGHRVVFAPQALLKEEALASEAAEYRMRIRVALRALWALWDKRALLNPWRFPLFSWQLVSHKLLRYLSVLPLSLAAVLNWLLLSRGGVYVVLAGGQTCVLLLGLLARRGPLRRVALARYCYYFLLLNCASAVALLRFLRGEKQVVWQPRTG